MKADARKAARRFREFWTLAKDSETGGYQKFWLSLLGDVLGADGVMGRIDFQTPVPMRGTTKFLDAWIPETRVLVEHKKRGTRLDAPQAGHGGKTPYEQALEYNIARAFDEKARWIVTCNFDEIWVYDMNRPLADPEKILLADLPREVARLGFLVDASVKAVPAPEEDLSIKAGQIVGALYKALLSRYQSPDAPETLKNLNRLSVRLVFLFYAEDAEIFPKDAFRRFLDATPAPFLRRRLLDLFAVLDTPDGSHGTTNARDPYLEPELAAFPYTNGGLFKNAAETEIPPLDDDIRDMLVKASNFDWRDISPTIFGALFESTLNPTTRRAGGMIYTSPKNIHKVIDPLFLDDLTRRVDALVGKSALSARAAEELQEEMGSLVFLDPACGSGNFLTETYIALRRLENRLVAARQKGGQGELDLGRTIKVSLAQFRGLEINDFAVAVAKTALWIAEAQMLHETAKVLHREPDYLPLHDYDGIAEGNALKVPWPKADYIIGNPPFSGARWMGPEQKADMLAVFGKDWPGVGNLDYVTAWYRRAVETQSRCAFVSTNSICQGDGVATLWRPLVERHGVEIDFAHRTFRWDNEAAEKAHVHCVIIGFHGRGAQGPTAPKTIFDGDTKIPAKHINAYLMDAPDTWIESRTTPLCDVPEMGMGNQPIDDGNYLFEQEEMESFIKQEPTSERYFRPWYGAEEFINGKKRYCLWLGDCSPHELRAMPRCLKRVENVRNYRLASKRASTRRIADKPTHFQTENMPAGNYIVVPQTSSENRYYIPIGFMPPESLCSNAVRIVPNATLYHFGVLTSSAHMAWMRVVTGRLKSSYQYASNIVYNNFPWPEGADEAAISATAQGILDARQKYPDSSLADLYDPLTMPADLRAAHQANDKAVLAAYGLKSDTDERALVAHLFALYAGRVES